LAGKKYVDLTHAFESGIPHWLGFPDEMRKTIYWYDKRPDTMGCGFFAEVFTHVGQWGTHVDPSAHFIKGSRTVDQIDGRLRISSARICKIALISLRILPNHCVALVASVMDLLAELQEYFGVRG